jgi:hypothetical protein
MLNHLFSWWKYYTQVFSTNYMVNTWVVYSYLVALMLHNSASSFYCIKCVWKLNQICLRQTRKFPYKKLQKSQFKFLSLVFDARSLPPTLQAKRLSPKKLISSEGSTRELAGVKTSSEFLQNVCWNQSKGVRIMTCGVMYYKLYTSWDKIFPNPYEKGMKYYDHHWKRCVDNWFWTSHYHSPYGCTNYDREWFVVSWFYSPFKVLETSVRMVSMWKHIKIIMRNFFSLLDLRSLGNKYAKKVLHSRLDCTIHT